MCINCLLDSIVDNSEIKVFYYKKRVRVKYINTQTIPILQNLLFSNLKHITDENEAIGDFCNIYAREDYCYYDFKNRKKFMKFLNFIDQDIFIYTA